VLGQSEAAGDLLGGQVLVDQPQAVTLARREALDGDRLAIVLVSPLVHSATLSGMRL